MGKCCFGAAFGFFLMLAFPAYAHGMLKVHNHTGEHLKVYCDNEFKGTVEPDQDWEVECTQGVHHVHAVGETGHDYVPKQEGREAGHVLITDDQTVTWSPQHQH